MSSTTPKPVRSFYDRDGSGKKYAAVEFAKLKDRPKGVSAGDFFVVK